MNGMFCECHSVNAIHRCYANAVHLILFGGDYSSNVIFRMLSIECYTSNAIHRTLCSKCYSSNVIPRMLPSKCNSSNTPNSIHQMFGAISMASTESPLEVTRNPLERPAAVRREVEIQLESSSGSPVSVPRKPHESTWEIHVCITHENPHEESTWEMYTREEYREEIHRNTQKKYREEFHMDSDIAVSARHPHAASRAAAFAHVDASLRRGLHLYFCFHFLVPQVCEHTHIASSVRPDSPPFSVRLTALSLRQPERTLAELHDRTPFACVICLWLAWLA